MVLFSMRCHYIFPSFYYNWIIHFLFMKWCQNLHPHSIWIIRMNIYILSQLIFIEYQKNNMKKWKRFHQKRIFSSHWVYSDENGTLNWTSEAYIRRACEMEKLNHIQAWMMKTLIFHHMLFFNALSKSFRIDENCLIHINFWYSTKLAQKSCVIHFTATCCSTIWDHHSASLFRKYWEEKRRECR